MLSYFARVTFVSLLPTPLSVPVLLWHVKGDRGCWKKISQYNDCMGWFNQYYLKSKYVSDREPSSKIIKLTI